MRFLALLLSLTGACDTTTPREPDASPDGAIDAATDASIDPPSVQRRGAPECEPLGSVESVELPPFHLTTDFFAGCPHRTEEPLPDRAFTWTAPSSGLYVFTLTSSVEFAPPLSLELRRGDCALAKSEGGSILQVEPICAGDYYVEEGRSPPYQVLAVKADETLTLVVEGGDYVDHGPGLMDRQTVGLHVALAPCPSAPVRSGGEPVTRVEELPSRVPVDLEIFSTSQNGRHLRDLSCVESEHPTRQYGVAWTAPKAGRYTFEVEGVADPSFVGVAVLQAECDGKELACESGEARAATSFDLESDERVIVMVDLDLYHVDDARIALRVRDAEAAP